MNGSARRTPTQLFGTSPPKPDQLGPQRLVSFAVGDLPMLTPHTYFRDGQPLTTGSGLLTRRTFTLDFARQRLARLNQVPDGEVAPVLSRDACLLGAAWGPMARSACIGLPQSDDPFAVCFPITEVLRWCYGSSSRMLQAVLSRDLPQVIRSVQKTMRREGEILDLELPEGFVEQDAPTLAWLASDPDALKDALRVDLSVLVNAHQDERKGPLSHPAAVFPSRYILNVTVLGRWIPHHPRPRFLVCRILATGQTLPFQVRLTRPDTEQPTPSPLDPTPPSRARRRGRVDVRKATLASKTEPRRQGSPSLLPALSSQFSVLPVLHRLGPPEEAVSGTTYTLPAAVGQFSTGLGEGRNGRASKAVLTLLKPPRAQPEGPVQNDAFTQLREVLEGFRQAGLSVLELPLNNIGGQEARFRGWFHADGTRVACLLARVASQGQAWYLVEQERAEDEYGPLLLARRPDGRPASGAELNDLLDHAQGPNTWPKTHELWTLIHVRHAFKSTDKFSRGLLERMGAANPRSHGQGNQLDS